AIAVLAFAPVIVWNANHEWASFLFQTVDRLNKNSHSGLLTLAASLLAQLTPVGLAAAMLALSLPRWVSRFENGRGDARGGLVLAIFTLVPLGVFIGFSLRHHMHVWWTGPVWLALVPSIASVMCWRRVDSRSWFAWAQRVWPATIGALMLAGAISLYVGAFGSRLGPLGRQGLPLPAWRPGSLEGGKLDSEVEAATGAGASSASD